MKRLFLLSFFFISIVTGLFAQSGKEAKFQVSIFPPLGTQGSYAKEYTNDFSFNILVGTSKNERYFTLGSLLNVIGNDASGFQLAGLGNIIGNKSQGIQIGGLFNIIGGNGQGMLLSGIFNSNKDYNGMQLAGLMNKSEDAYGIQLAGLINKARNVNGVQLAGLMNIAESCDYPIGLINIIRNGEMGIGISYNETGTTTLSFRSGGRVLYGIFGVGYNHRSDVSEESFVMEVGLGAHINIKESFRINTEMKSHQYGFRSTSLNSIAVFPAFKFGNNFEIFAGPSINYMDSDTEKNRNIFPDMSLNIWKDFEGKRYHQVYIGFSLGVQYIF